VYLVFPEIPFFLISLFIIRDSLTKTDPEKKKAKKKIALHLQITRSGHRTPEGKSPGNWANSGF
jgi:hypothetical protein